MRRFTSLLNATALKLLSPHTQQRWKRIEVVITSRTRNAVTGNRPRVRISPLPPKQKSTLTRVLFRFLGNAMRNFAPDGNFVKNGCFLRSNRTNRQVGAMFGGLQVKTPAAFSNAWGILHPSQTPHRSPPTSRCSRKIAKSSSPCSSSRISPLPPLGNNTNSGNEFVLFFAARHFGIIVKQNNLNLRL